MSAERNIRLAKDDFTSSLLEQLTNSYIDWALVEVASKQREKKFPHLQQLGHLPVDHLRENRTCPLA